MLAPRSPGANFGPDLPGSLAVHKRQASKQTEQQMPEGSRIAG